MVDDDDDEPIEVIKVIQKKSPSNPSTIECSSAIDIMIAMGFDRWSAQQCLTECHDNVEAAIESKFNLCAPKIFHHDIMQDNGW